MSFNLTTSHAIIWAAGKDANSTAFASGSIMAKWCDEAEAVLAADTKYDWVANYSSVLANTQQALSEAAAARAAIKLVKYDMSGYPSRTYAETTLDVLDNTYRELVKVLKEKPLQDFMV